MTPKPVTGHYPAIKINLDSLIVKPKAIMYHWGYLLFNMKMDVLCKHSDSIYMK